MPLPPRAATPIVSPMNTSVSKQQPLRFLSPLHRATKAIHAALSADMARLGISNAEGHLLSYLLSYAPRSAGEIAEALDLKRPTLTGMCDRLEEAGLLARAINPEDRRSFLVDLTPAGRRRARRVRRVLDAFEARLSAEISEEDRRGFVQVLQALARVTETPSPTIFGDVR